MSGLRVPSSVLWLTVLLLPLAGCPNSCGEAAPTAEATGPTETPGDSRSADSESGGPSSSLAIVEIAPGEGHTVALTADGSVWTSGNGGDGQLGFEQTDVYFHGVRVEGLPTIRDVAAGTAYSIFLAEDGSLWGAGYGIDERLGPTASERFTTPVELGIDGLSDVAAYTNFTLGRRASDDMVVAFGVNDAGGLGHGSNADSATLVETGVTAGLIDAGDGFSFGLTNGTIKAWGMNNYGTLGNSGVASMSMGNTSPSTAQGFFSLSPVDVELDCVAVDVSAGIEHALAACEDGRVFGWGRHTQGSLGQPGDNQLFTVPVQVPGLSGIVAVAAGRHLSLALAGDGTVYSWGQSAHGRLGRTVGESFSAEPTPIQGLPPIAKIVAGIDRGYAIDREGAGWAWGNNEYGQLLHEGEGLGPPERIILGGGD